MIELPGQARDSERTPPQDINAEQSVLGGMLLSKDAIADVVEVLHGHDFYRPAHQTVFDAVLDLYGRGEPADAITVAAELTKRGEIARVGGAAYLHTLMSSVPTAANAGYYAKIVAEKAILRRLVEAGTRIVQLGYAGNGGDVDEIVDRAQAAIYDVTERRTADDYSILESLLQPTMDEIEASGQRGAGLTGVPTGFNDLDALTNGLHPGQLVVVAGRPAMGKALALDTPLATPFGWTTMGDVAVGDLLLGADGRPTRVVAATEVMVDRPCYEVEFDDGSVIVADAQHQWLTVTRAARKRAQELFARSDERRAPETTVHTTEQLAATLRCKAADRRLNHCVTNTAPIDVSEASLPLQPYALGVWLGDGHSASARYTSDDPEIAMHVEDDGLDVVPRERRLYSLRLRRPHVVVPTRECVVCGRKFTPATTQVRTCGKSCGGRAKTLRLSPLPAPSCPTCGGCTTSGFRPCAKCIAQNGSVPALLRTMGVLGDKHIPALYLRASVEQRRALLAGLLDTDGTVSPTGAVQITLTNLRLALDVRELVVSLGYRCGWQEKPVRGRRPETSIGYVITFSPVENPFRLERKRLVFKDRVRARSPRMTARFIVDVRRVESVPVRCVEVDNDSHLYLAGRSMIPTHNSTLGLDIARAASIKHHQTSVLFSLEMSKHEITMRLLSAEARIPLQYMRTGRMGDDDWVKLTRRLGEMASAPLYIDDSPNLTMMEIRAKARRLKQRNDLRLVIVDYLQLMTSHSRVENRQQEVSQISRSMKLLAKELEVPVIALSQLNRGPEQRTDKKPQLSDLRECLSGDTVIARRDTGERVAIRELAGCRDVPIWSVDERLRVVPAVMSDVWSTGTREVWRLTLASGRTITATANHPLRTVHGWCPVEGLSVGDFLATTRASDAPDSPKTWPDSALRDSRSNPDIDIDIIPPAAWDYVRKAMRAAGVTTRQLAELLEMSHCGSALYKAGLSRVQMARVAAAVPEPFLRDLATSDVRWDRITAIEPAGSEEVFDAHVPGTHSFLANDVVSHNSGAIEQDADVVILLHREDVYERESPRAGEADLIVAKHRNGPTDTLIVAFQGHYSRFVDMAPG